jgi:protease-4
MLSQVTGALAERRGLEAGEVRRLIDRAPLTAQRARKAGLIDRLGYLDGFEAAVLDATGLERPDPDDAGPSPVLPLLAYDAVRADELPADAPQIAVVYGQGPVQLGESQDAPLFGDVVMGSDTLAPAILEAARDPEIAAIVLRVDSPGGSYIASDAVARAVRQARELGTPVVVSMGNTAGSGGYFVAAPADRIYASGGTITGSIGVASGKFVLTGLWDRIEVNFDGVQAGDNADYWSPNRDFSERQWQRLQTRLDQTYADFKATVRAGRGLSAAEVEEAAQGKIWTGADARDLGLVDELGGLAAALDGAKELAEIPAEVEVRTVERPGRPEPLRALLEGALKGQIDSPAARALGRIAETLRPVVDLVALLEGDAADRRLRAPVTADNLR